jgi:glutamate racemase
MHALITDSGVGGLSVVAYAERFVLAHGFAERVTLTFANAAPANDYGYNSMPSREEKLATFDRFLRNVTGRFAPDSIYVACNTLSVLLPETPYFAKAAIPVKGIVETGAALLLNALEADPRSVAVIFGTQTTIDVGAYPRIFTERGIVPSRIVSQACPGLADVISEDREGSRTAPEIRKCVGSALERLGRPDVPVIAYLGCTHYGYRAEQFAAAFADAGMTARVVNPNERAIDDIFVSRPDPGGTVSHDVDVRFVTRYVLPPATVETLSWLLDDISPRTVAAMRNFVVVPDLF